MFVSEYFKKRQFLKKEKVETNVVKDEELNLLKFKEEISNEINVSLENNKNKREDK